MTHHFNPAGTVGRNSEIGSALKRARSSLRGTSGLTSAKATLPRARKLAFDPLEKRFLLSADISPYLDTFDDGLDRLEALADDLEQFAEMSAAIPIVGESLGEAADLAGTLRSELIDPIQALLNGGLVDQTLGGLETALNNIAGVSVTGTVCDANEISLDAEFDTSVTLSDQLFDLGVEAETIGLEFDALFDFDVALSFDFGFGVLLDPALSPGDAFFLDSDSSLSVSGSADLRAAFDAALGNGSEGARVGLLGEATLDAMTTFAVSAAVDVTLDDPSTGDGIITMSELDAGGIGLAVVTINNAGTGLTGDLKIDASANGISNLVIADAGISLGLSGNFFEDPTITVSITTPELADFTRVTASTLLSFLGDLGGKLDTLATGFTQLAEADFLDLGIGDLADFNDAARNLIDGLSVPGLLSATDIDFDALVGGPFEFDIELTLEDPNAAVEVVTLLIENVSLDLGNIALTATSAQDIADAIDAALAGIVGTYPIAARVQAFVENGQVGLRTINDPNDTAVIKDIALRDVAAEITAAIGLQTDQTGLPLPTFQTAQEFAERLAQLPIIDQGVNGGLINLGYDAATASLTFNLDILNETFAESVSLSFKEVLSLNLPEPLSTLIGEIALTGSADASIDADVGFSFGAGLDLTAIDGSTTLASLNGGVGFGFSTNGGDDLLFQFRDGTSAAISLAGAVDIDDVITAISTGTTGRVVVEIDALGTGLVFTETGVTPIEDNMATTTVDERVAFAVTGGQFSNAIYDLGLGFGAASNDFGNVISGATVVDRFFLDASSTNIGASITVTADDINLFGSVGFLTFGVQNGKLGGDISDPFYADLVAERGGDDTLDPLFFELAVNLIDPDMSGRIYLSELTRAANDGPISFAPPASGPDSSLEIELTDGTVFTVDLSSATTVAGALALIEAASGTFDHDGDAGTAQISKISAGISAAGNSVIIIDRTADDPDLDTTIASLNLPSQPIDEDGETVDRGPNTVTIDGVTFEFQDDGSVEAGNTSVAIGATTADTAANLAAAINAAFAGTYSAMAETVGGLDRVTLTHLVPGAVDPTLSTDTFVAGTVWEARGFRITDLGDRDAVDTAAELLGLGAESSDVGGDGTVAGSALVGAGFAALDSLELVGTIEGELVLPIFFDDAGALGLGIDPIFITVGFVKGSILPDIRLPDGDALQQLFEIIQNLGSQDLLTLVTQIGTLLTEKIDLLNVELPLIDSSLGDLVQFVEDEFGDVVEAFNKAITDTLDEAVDTAIAAYEDLVDLGGPLAQIDPALVNDFLASFEGQTILDALQDLKAQVQNLPQGFDLLFSDAPTRLLSAFAAIKGAFLQAIDPVRSTFAGDARLAQLQQALEDALRDKITDIKNIVPSTETILRLIQEALGFELPSLDEELGIESALQLLANIEPLALNALTTPVMTALDTAATTLDTALATFRGVVVDIQNYDTNQLVPAEINAYDDIDFAEVLAKIDEIRDYLTNAGNADSLAALIDDIEAILAGPTPEDVANELDRFQAALKQLLEYAKCLGGEVLETLQDFIDATTETTRNAIGFAEDLIEDLTPSLDDIANALLGNASVRGLVGQAATLLDTAQNAADTALGTFAQAVQDAEDATPGSVTFLTDIQTKITELQDLLNGTDPGEVQKMIDDLNAIASGDEDIFDLVALFPDVSAFVASIADCVESFLDLDFAGIGQAALDDITAALRGLVADVIEEVRAALLGFFGGGLLQLDIGDGDVDVGFYLAPTLYSVDLGGTGFNFGFDVGGNSELFNAGINDAALAFALGGVIDVGLRLQYADAGGGFGSDFDLLFDKDSVLGLNASLEVSGELEVSLGSIGVVFGPEMPGDPVVALTDLDGDGPAFFEVTVSGAEDVDNPGYIAFDNLGFDATLEAKLSGNAVAFEGDGTTQILWDGVQDGTDNGDVEQVAVGFDAAVSFNDGFDFSFDPNALVQEELDAIFESLTRFDFGNLLDAFTTILEFLETALGPDGLGGAPVIGDDLATAAGYIEDFRLQVEAFIDDLETIGDADNVVGQVQQFLFDTFGPGGTLDFLTLQVFDGVTEDYIDVTAKEEIAVNFYDTSTDTALNTILDADANTALVIEPLRLGFFFEEEVPFDFGLDAFVFEANGEGDVEITGDLFLDIGFGLSVKEGAYLVMADRLDSNGDIVAGGGGDGIADEVLGGNFSAKVDDETTLNFSLFFLGLDAQPWIDIDGTAENEGLTFDAAQGNAPTDPEGQGVSFEAALGLGFSDKNGNAFTGSGTTLGGGIVAPILDLGGLRFDPSITFRADADLVLTAGVQSGSTVNENLPTLTTFLNVDWEWNPLNNDDAGAVPAVAFYDLRLDMGEFIENALGTLLESIQDFTAPLDPFLDFLDLEIPIISQLSELFGQGEVTFIDAIRLLGSGVESIEILLDILDTINTVLDLVDTLAAGTFINFGDLIITNSPGIDLRDVANRDVVGGDGLFSMANTPPSTNQQQIEDQLDDEQGGFLSGIFDTLDEVGLSLPFIEEPSQLFGLLFGQRVDFVVWDIPRLSAEFGVSYKFGPILPPVPLFVTIGGGFEIFLDLVVGYDSRGVETGDFFDGFYFGDASFDSDTNTFNNDDPLELGLSVFFEATASLSVLVAEAGVTGGVEAEIGANWHDPNNDGKFYLDELVDRAQQGILCIFDLEGALTAFLEAFVKLGFDTPFGFVTLFEETFELLRVTLLDFSITCPPLPEPQIATVVGSDANGDIARLNIGTNAADRQPGAGDDDEMVEMFGDRVLSPDEEVISLWASGKTINDAVGAGLFSNGKLTRVDAGVSLRNNDGILNADLDLNNDGEIDTDEIRRVNDLDGNGQNDAQDVALLIGFGEWEIFEDLSYIYGDANEGDDEIIGDASLDVSVRVDGGAGDDELVGGSGDDTLIGGEGNDLVIALAGDDEASGDGTAGENATGLSGINLSTGTGIDQVFGGAGGDLIHGGGNNDQLFGASDGDTDGDTADTLYGGAGEDVMVGALGADLLFGGQGADNISGDEGNDRIEGGSETDLIQGGLGADSISGDGGNDIIFGETDGLTDEEASAAVGSLADTIYAGAGEDEVRGQFGNDLIFGGLNDDRLIGGEGDDSIKGDQGSDEIFGDRLASDGLDPVDGADRIEGGAGADEIFGQGGADLIIGGVSNLADYSGFYSDLGDLIRGGAGNDIILGDDGTITDDDTYSTNVAAAATGGADRIYGEAGDDQIAGGHGADLIFSDNSGGAGEDIVSGDQIDRDGLGITVTADANDDADQIFGYGGADLLIGGGAGDGIFGSTGADLIVGDYALITLKASGNSIFDQIARVESIDQNSGGDDRMLAESGGDIVIGGFGDDYISGGGTGDDANILLGDHGLVVRDDGSSDENDIFSLFGAVGGIDEILGGDDNDIILGGGGADEVFARGGDDVVLGDAGAVFRDAAGNPERVVTTFSGNAVTGISAGARGGGAADAQASGDDDIDGGTGSDILIGGLASDIIFGRDGGDVLVGDNAEVTYTGSGTGIANVTQVDTQGTNGAADALLGEGGEDVALGGAGADLLFGDLTATINRGGSLAASGFAASGTAGRDVMAGDHGSVSLANGLPTYLTTADDGFGGNDLLEGHGGDDVLLGGFGRDIVHGDAPTATTGLVTEGNDVLLGDGGFVDWQGGDASAVTIDVIDATVTIGDDDVLLGNGGNDVAFGGAGGDRLLGDFSADVDLTSFALTNRSGTANGGDDVLVGDLGTLTRVNDENNALTGLGVVGGVDFIEGHDGIDALIGGADRDALTGDAYAADFTAGLISNADTGDDALIGDSGLIEWRLDGDSTSIDRIRSADDDGGVNGGNDVLFGNDGADIAIGGLGNDLVLGDFRVDVVDLGIGFGTLNTQAAQSGIGADDILAGDGAELLQAGGKPVYFTSRNVANGGADNVEGHDGSDVLIGGTDADKLVGDAYAVDFNLIQATGDDVLLGDNGLVDWAHSTVNPGADQFDASAGDGLQTTIDLVSTIESAIGGDDVLLGNDGNDIAMGGAGADALLGDLRGNVGFGTTVTSRAGAAAGGVDILVGDSGSLSQADGAPTLLISLDPAIGGNDLIEGHDLGDIMIGGAGSDVMHGDAATADIAKIAITGNDVLLGDSGLVDWAFSTLNPGVDEFDASAGDGQQSTIDRIASIAPGIGGMDALLGNDGNDIAIGGADDDIVLGDLTADVSAALAVSNRQGAASGGADILLGDSGQLDLNGGDAIFLTSVDSGGFDGDDLIEGHDLGDVMIGGLGSDVMHGDAVAADKALIATGGADVLLGDAGLVDWAFDAANPGADAFDATQGDNQQGTIDRVKSLSVAEGADDVLSGGDFNDIAFGGFGDDKVMGDLLVDVTFASLAITSRIAPDTAGADILLGDSGELVQANGLPTTLFSTDGALGGNDLVEGHDLADILIGGAGQDILHGEAATADIGKIAAAADDIILGDNGLVDWIGGDGDQSDIDLIDTIDPAIGDIDIILGNDGRDILLGGLGGDQIYGDRTADVALGTLVVSNEQTGGTVGVVDTDIILGDNGTVDYEVDEGVIEGRPDLVGVSTAVVVSFLVDTVLVTTTDPTLGGADLILGDGAADLIAGGTASDRIWGDDGNFADAATDGDDLIFGDHGKVWLTPGTLRASPFGDDYFAIDITAADGGAGDLIFGEGGNDIAMGQQGDDVIFGGTGDDDLIGGHNRQGGSDDLDGLNVAQVVAINGLLAEHNPIDLQEVNDVIDGDEGEDVIAGDNAAIKRENVQTNPRYRALIGTELYSMVTADVPVPGVQTFTVDVGFTPNVGGAVADPRSGFLTRSVTLFDFDLATEQAAAANPTLDRPFGDDIISGGLNDDEIFGQLGDDIIEGDGSIDLVDAAAVLPFNPSTTANPSFVIPDGFFDLGQTNLLIQPQPIAGSGSNALLFNVFSSLSDGDDYVEGGGGNDRMYGNLGQDDLIGGSSNLFSTFGTGTGADLRPDGADLIYGNSGQPGSLARGATEAADAPLVGADNFHTADADFIAGDNANIYRLDGLAFAYATGAGYGAVGGSGLDRDLEVRVIELLDYAYTLDGSQTNPETGTVDWKTRFSDFGTGLGDLIHGEGGDDWIHGMTGDDLVFGEAGDDDIYGQAGADVLFGGTGEDGILGDDGLLSTSRNGTAEALYGVVATTQEIIRTPGNLQLAIINRTGELNKAADMIAFDLDGAAGVDMTSANDIIFGGLQDDWIHAGYGSDAVSGAEALPEYYTGGTAVNAFLKAQQNFDGNAPVADDPFWIDLAIYNPGDILRFGALDPEEFALYDENDPRSAVMVTANGETREFLLNWLIEGPIDATFTSALLTDGQDNIFGDLGADWIVGGTGRDHMFGGRGNDLINMDDDLTTNGGANTDPDAYQEYADISYDGAGRDVIILNTGADRAIAWVGEYNSYLTPFSPFGAFHVSRTLQPQTEQFVLDLARANGSDESMPDILRFAEQFAIDDKLDNPAAPDIYTGTGNGGQAGRFGSPFNELGMVRQEDFDWQDQTGSPDDPQAGNDKGKREIMRRELWMPEDTNGAIAASLDTMAQSEMALVEQSFLEVYGEETVTITQSGITTVSDGITIIADFLDMAVDVIEIDTVLQVEKAMKGLKANAFVVFDYASDSDYKFAGVDVSRNKIQIGYRSGDSWIIVAEVNAQLKPDTPYDLSIRLEGGMVIVRVDGEERLVYTFDESVVDGAVGLATNNAEASFTDTTIDATVANTVEIVDGDTGGETTSGGGDTGADTGGSGSTDSGGSTDNGGDGSVDWGDTDVDDSNGTGLVITATEAPAASSDPVTVEEETIFVQTWAPRDDFNSAA